MKQKVIPGGDKVDQYNKYDDIKRKLRELKKLEMKIRSFSVDVLNHKNNVREFENTQLIWNQFFCLKDEISKKVKYSISDLSSMTKDTFKDIINEYLSHVYYCYYKESGFTDDVDIKRKFRELIKIYHPDNGGDTTKFIEMMEHYKNNKN